MSEPRYEAAVFDDLRNLCHEPGFLHAISFIVFRDFFVSIDLQGHIKRHSDTRPARSELNHNELILLMGLLVQSDSTSVFEQITDTDDLVSRADALLEKFHQALELPMRQMANSLAAPGPFQKPFGELAKEAIYYGPDSAFPFQYQRLARQRYRKDFAWLVANKGLSIRPMIEIATAVTHAVNYQITALAHEHGARLDFPTANEVSSALLIDKAGLVAKFGDKAVCFMQAFCTPVNHANRLSVAPLPTTRLPRDPFWIWDRASIRLTPTSCLSLFTKALIIG